MTHIGLLGEHQRLENTGSLHALQSKHLLLVRYITAEVSDLKFREMFEQNSDVDKTAAVESSAEITLVVALLRRHHTTNSEKIHAEISEKFFQTKKYKIASGQTGEGNPSCETGQLAGGTSPSPTAGRGQGATPPWLPHRGSCRPNGRLRGAASPGGGSIHVESLWPAPAVDLKLLKICRNIPMPSPTIPHYGHIFWSHS